MVLLSLVVHLYEYLLLSKNSLLVVFPFRFYGDFPVFFLSSFRFLPLAFLLCLESRSTVGAATVPGFLEGRPLLEEVEKVA